jgi:hypothetical protein
MEQFPAYTHSPSRTRKSAAWVTANSLVVITQVGDEFTVDETTTATQMAAWQFVRGRPEEATMGIRELGGVARYCRMVEVADWERLWAMIEQYPDFAQKFASG